MTLMQFIILVFAGIVIASTLTDFIRLDDWWLRLFDFPRQQITILGLVTVIGYVVSFELYHYGHWIVLFLLILSLIHQFRRIYPFTFLAPKQVVDCREPDSEYQISLLVSNVLMGNRQAQALIRLVRRKSPDILLLLEPDAWWDNRLRELEADYPYRVKQPLENLYGMNLYSRLKLIEPQVKYLVEEDIPSIHTRVRLRSQQSIRLYCLHPTPPTPPQKDSSAERDAELLLVGRETADLDEPTIVAGDLNDVAWSQTTALFQNISGLLDPRKGRGFYSTFHAKYPFMRWPLDHVFHSHDFTLVDIRRLPSIGSDHFPIHVVLRLNTKAQAWQEEPEPETDDLEWAREKIEKAEERKTDRLAHPGLKT